MSLYFFDVAIIFAKLLNTYTLALCSNMFEFINKWFRKQTKIELVPYAQVYMRKGALLIHPLDTVLKGFLVATEPFINLNDNVSDAELGGAAMRCLHLAKCVNNVPNNVGYLKKNRWKAFGVRSERQFCSDTRLIHIAIRDESIEITPNKKDGSGFLPLDTGKINAPIESPPEEVGRLIRRGLALGITGA